MKQISNLPSPDNYRLAAYIVGCLIHEDCLRVDFKNVSPVSIEFEHIEVAMRIIAACLRDTIPPSDEVTSIPFEW